MPVYFGSTSKRPRDFATMQFGSARWVDRRASGRDCDKTYISAQHQASETQAWFPRQDEDTCWTDDPQEPAS